MNLVDIVLLVLLIASTQQDFESGNFACILLDPSGKELSKTGVSIPKFAPTSTNVSPGFSAAFSSICVARS